MAPSVVMITGCSTGIGRATAVHLAKKCNGDFKVYATVVDLSETADLETAAGDSLNKTLFIRELDVTKEATISAAVDEILRENGRIDVLFNNAGISQFDDHFLQQDVDDDDDDFAKPRAMMNINFWGAVRVMKAVLPTMKKQKSGRILNMSSLTGVIGSPFLSLYSASKFALEGFSESSALVLRKAYNIRVSLLEPGCVETAPLINVASSPLSVSGAWDDVTQEMFQGFITTIENSIKQEPEEIARLVEEIIRSDNPHLRYQSDDLVKGYVELKVVDSTGDSIFEADTGMFK
ncbi:retinol dehydrogenase 8-like [Asterias rubens]|uniref:retinol dehydrogenase 8-like n=1 Tax=Asterias rubens TaxID=7604 RepID=UPI0014551A1E|nr:retinol dehydrogenase 8-like [Asterias rubens]